MKDESGGLGVFGVLFEASSVMINGATVTMTKKEYDLLLKDRERIDWLGDKSQAVGNVQLPIKCIHNNLHSLRDAIDEAMEL
jgi:hypothetical protein